MRRNKSPFIVMVASVLFAGIAAFSGSLAWFTATAFMQNEDNPIEGSVEDEYYASGLGTSDDPFVITKPRHLYNLAWLQYLGFYNKNSGPDNHQFYFKLGDNIDMSKFGAIPPIGSELNPFVGNFNGAGYVVSNVTISNNFNDFTSHPSSISAWDNNTTHKQPHIMGFFGVIGEYPGGNKNSAYDTNVNEFKNTGLTGVTIKTVLPDSLAGVAAGYVRDSSLSDTHTVLKNVVVDNSTISLPQSGTTSSYGKDVNNVNLTKISEYTLVGYTNNKAGVVKASKEVYGINLENNITFNATEDGNTEGWGGSIDMKSVLTRLQTIRSRGSWSTFVYHKRRDYHEGTPNQNTTNVNTSNSNYTNIIVDTNHEEWGHFNFISESDYRDNYALMGGGHYETQRYYEYLQNAKISTTGPHYLTGSNFNNNSGSVSDTTVESDALTWVVPSKDKGSSTIYTTYRSNNQNRTYYLRYNNGTLSLTTTANNATTFQRSEVGGKVRFTYNGYYLDYDNGWKMVQITGAPVEPTRPNPPTPPDAPILPPTPVKPKQSDYYITQTQISDGSNYLKYSGSGNGTFSSGEATYPWFFSSSPTDGGTINIYTTINGTNYYIANNTGNAANATFTTNQSDAAIWTVSLSDEQYRFYYSYNSGGWFSTTYYYYLTNNNGTLYISRPSGSGWSGPTLNVNNATALTVTPVQVVDTAAYNAAYAEYETALANYNAAVASYEEDMEEYDELYEQYLEDVEYYDTVTYPAYEEDLEEFMQTAAAFDASTHKLTVTGSLSNTEYIDHETGGMSYADDDVTYFPLSTVNNTDNFNPSDSNTAYVVAGSSIKSDTTTYDSDVTNVRFSKAFPISYISQDYTASSGKWNHVYTVNDNMQREDITNNETDYAKLKNAKDTLGKVMKGQSNTYGLHFMESTISMDAITTAKYIKVNGEEHENYQLPVNSIDFHLKEFGYINFMAATYFNTGHNAKTNNDSFFSLYQIERNPTTHAINRILEVKNVYQHASRSKNYSYVYELTDGESTFYTKPYKMLDSEGHKAWLYDEVTNWSENQYVNVLPQAYAKVFKVQRIMKNNIASNTFNDHVFFFEIPMNDGEFCLGSVEGAVGSYLLYLDIGANAAETNRTIVYEKFTMTQKSYSYPVGVSLKPLPTTYTSGTATININTTVDDADSACMEIQATANGDYKMDRTDNTVAITRSNTTLAPPVYAGEDVTLTGSGTLTPAHISATSYNVVRMQYYDYMINTDSLCVTTITDYYNSDDSSVSRVIEQNRYSGTRVNDEPTSSLIYDPDGMISDSSDDIDDIKIYNTATGVRYDSSVVINSENFVIDNNKLSDTVILEIKVLQTGGDTYEDVTTLVLVVDTEASQTDTYYTFDNYTIVLTPSNGTIVVKVISYEGEFEMTVYNYDEESSSTVDVTTVITINGSTITGEGQTIPNP